jgi:hypothetical protein
MTPMTEGEWLDCPDPERLLMVVLGETFPPRKVRLFACACCRRWWREIPEQPGRRAVEVAERFADRRESRQALARADEACERFVLDTFEDDSRARKAVAGSAWVVKPMEMTPDAFEASVQAARWMCEVAGEAAALEAVAQCRLLRCVFGNPFRPVSLAPAQRAPAAVSLARAAYEERQLPSGELDPHRAAVPADALEEAGSPDELVAHLRGPGPHVRGCFAVDLCLGLS